MQVCPRTSGYTCRHSAERRQSRQRNRIAGEDATTASLREALRQAHGELSVARKIDYPQRRICFQTIEREQGCRFVAHVVKHGSGRLTILPLKSGVQQK